MRFPPPEAAGFLGMSGQKAPLNRDAANASTPLPSSQIGLMFGGLTHLFSRRKQREKIIYRHSDSDFGVVVVADKNRARYLKFGNHIKQGGMDLNNPGAVYLEYQRAMLAIFEEKSFARCLCLGLGAGSIPKYIHQNGLCQRVDVVEINPVVIDVARSYFGLPEEVTVHNVDALDFIDGTSMRYDLLFVDLFDKAGTPIKFKALSFYRRLYGVLKTGGVVVVNMWSSDFGDLLLEEKLGSVFDEVQVVKASRNHITICKRV